ncbi:glycosyltransferase family 4 protein [Akkermansiaceae bacterium]|nr:glycosyltransferase family 4 protein [Akkermansiaceae bacterium]
MKKVTFVTVIVSPFQIELTDFINEYLDIDFTTVFTKTRYKGRGEHWKAYKSKGAKIRIVDVRTKISKIRSLYKTLKSNKPELIVIGQIRGIVPTVCRFYAWKNRVPFVFWLEQPFPKKNIFSKTLKDLDCFLNLFGCRAVVGIGNRAVNYYSRFAPSFMVPYSQDLHFINKAYEKHKTSDPKVRFLFSGQLIPRHNIHLITGAIEMLYDDIGCEFRFTFAASGELRHLVDRVLEQRPELNSIIKFDTKYEEWNDRLKPFFYSDVLVYPSRHSGWGLVIPEALASGLTIITTKNVEAARHFISDSENGIFIEESVIGLYKSMKRCVEDKKGLESMRMNAIKSYQKGDISSVGPQLVNHLLELIED